MDYQQRLQHYQEVSIQKQLVQELLEEQDSKKKSAKEQEDIKEDLLDFT